MNRQIFDQTITDLEKVHPELLTGEGLSKLLWSCMGKSLSSKTKSNKFIEYKEVLFPAVYYGLLGLEADPLFLEFGQRFMADPKGWTLDAPEGVKQGAEYYHNLSTVFQKSGNDMSTAMADMFFYHSIRDNIQELQKNKGISCIKGKRLIELLNGSIEVHDFCDQLELVGNDAELMEQDARKIVNLFLSEMTQTNNYEYEDEEQKTVSIGEIFECCQTRIIEAGIYTECINWVKSSDGFGWVSNGVTEHDPVKDPTKITLHIETEDDTKSFHAIHVDKSRFPWNE